MKTFVRGVIRDEKGAGVLALVLVLLVVGGLVLTPLLGLMGTGLMAGQVYEKKTHELYSADAGVEDVMWRILYDPIPSELWEASDLPDWKVYRYPEPLSVGNKSVDVEVYRKDRDWTPCRDDFTYRVLSTAVTDDSGGTAGIDSSTTVEAYIEPLVLDLFGGALVSMTDISLKKDTKVEGDVYYVREITPEDFQPTGGETIQVSGDVFPSQQEVDDFVGDLKALASAGGTHNGTMKISSDTILNSTYIAGDLYIAADATLTINGVVYVRDSVWVKKEVQDYNLAGSGSLIAERDIDLRKVSGFGASGDSIIMSVYGAINFKKEGSVEAVVYAPNGLITIDKGMTVVGSVVGKSIQADKEGSFTYVPKASSFGFFAPTVYGAEIKTYTINPLLN